MSRNNLFQRSLRKICDEPSPMRLARFFHDHSAQACKLFTLEGLYLASNAPGELDDNSWLRLIEEIVYRHLICLDGPFINKSFCELLRIEGETDLLERIEYLSEHHSQTQSDTRARDESLKYSLEQVLASGTKYKDAIVRALSFLSPTNDGSFPVICSVRPSYNSPFLRSAIDLHFRPIPYDGCPPVLKADASFDTTFQQSAYEASLLAKSELQESRQLGFELMDNIFGLAIEGASGGLAFLTGSYLHYIGLPFPPRLALSGRLVYGRLAKIERVNDKLHLCSNAGFRWVFTTQQNDEKEASDLPELNVKPLPQNATAREILSKILCELIQIDAKRYLTIPTCHKLFKRAKHLETKVYNYPQATKMYTVLNEALTKVDFQCRERELGNLKLKTLLGLGRVHSHLGQAPKALTYFDQADELKNELNQLGKVEAELYLDAQNRQAIPHIDLYDYEKAERILLNNLKEKESQKIRDTISEAHTHGSLGQLYTFWGQLDRNKLDKAEEHLKLALEGVELEEKPRNQNYLAALYINMRRFDEAEALLQESLKRNCKPSNAPFAQFYLIKLFCRRGQYERNSTLFEKSISESDQFLKCNSSYSWLKALVLHFRGVSQRELGCFSGAEECFHEAYEILRDTQDPNAPDNTLAASVLVQWYSLDLKRNQTDSARKRVEDLTDILSGFRLAPLVRLFGPHISQIRKALSLGQLPDEKTLIALYQKVQYS